MGFPVRVIATSDKALCWSPLWANLGADRTTVGREAILAAVRVARRPLLSAMGGASSSAG